jgi:DNA-binding transcriptional MerR regulator
MSKNDRTYTISELATEFGVTARALRFYEDKGLLSPRREGLARIYSARERARLQLILRGKRIGFPLNEIKQALDLYDMDDGKRAQLKLVHDKFRDRLGQLKLQRVELDKTIEDLEADIAALDDRLKQLAGPAASKAARAYDQVARSRLQETTS